MKVFTIITGNPIKDLEIQLAIINAIASGKNGINIK